MQFLQDSGVEHSKDCHDRSSVEYFLKRLGIFAPLHSDSTFSVVTFLPPSDSFVDFVAQLAVNFLTFGIISTSSSDADSHRTESYPDGVELVKCYACSCMIKIVSYSRSEAVLEAIAKC